MPTETPTRLEDMVRVEERWCHIPTGVDFRALCGERDEAPGHGGFIRDGRCSGCGERKCPDCLRAWRQRGMVA